jgi:hypothetical protein
VEEDEALVESLKRQLQEAQSRLNERRAAAARLRDFVKGERAEEKVCLRWLFTPFETLYVPCVGLHCQYLVLPVPVATMMGWLYS